MDESLFTQFRDVESRHWWFRARREILLTVLRHELPAGSRFLDIGCGTGFLLDGAREFLDVWGIDVAPVALEMCRARGIEKVSHGSASDLTTVADHEFDCAGLFDVIEHLDDDVGALRGVREVLRPGGLVLVTVPAFMFLWSAHDEINHHRRRYTRAGLARVLQEADFTIEKLTYFNAWLFPAAALSRVVGRMLPSRPSAGLSVPPAPVNALCERLFRSERERVRASGPSGGFPAGLSIMALGRRT